MRYHYQGHAIPGVWYESILTTERGAMEKKIRHRVEKIVLATIVVGGITAAVADAFGWLDRLAPGRPIEAITLGILCMVALAVLLEMGSLESLDRLREILDQLDIEALSRKLSESHYGGVVRIHESFGEQVQKAFNEHIGAARKQVAILQTWAPNLEKFEDSLRAAVDRGVEVRVLLLFPDSELATWRDRALSAIRDPALDHNVSAGVHRNLCVLQEIAKDAGRERRRYISVRIYNSMPSVAVYKADEHYFASEFVHGRLAIDSPQREVDGAGTFVGRLLQRELDTLWQIGRDVELENWRHSLKNMDFTRPHADPPEPEGD